MHTTTGVQSGLGIEGLGLVIPGLRIAWKHVVAY